MFCQKLNQRHNEIIDVIDIYSTKRASAILPKLNSAILDYGRRHLGLMAHPLPSSPKPRVVGLRLNVPRRSFVAAKLSNRSLSPENFRKAPFSSCRHYRSSSKVVRTAFSTSGSLYYVSLNTLPLSTGAEAPFRNPAFFSVKRSLRRVHRSPDDVFLLFEAFSLADSRSHRFRSRVFKVALLCCCVDRLRTTAFQHYSLYCISLHFRFLFIRRPPHSRRQSLHQLSRSVSCSWTARR